MAVITPVSFNVKSVKTEFSTPWFELVAKTVSYDEHPYYSLKLGDYAAVVPVTAEGEIILVKQYRPAVETFTLEFPSGLVEENESPLESIQRELLEETGTESPEWVELGPPLFADTGRLSNRLHCFMAAGVVPAKVRPPADENIEVVQVSLGRLQKEILDGKFSLALHLSLLSLAMMRGNIRF